MSAKSKRRRKAKRAFDRTADARVAARLARMRRAVAEHCRVRDAVRDGTATDEEREKHEDQMRLIRAWPPGLLSDNSMSWEALERHLNRAQD